MELFKKWWPSILPGIAALWAVYSSDVQHFIAAHATLSIIVAGAYAVVTHLMPSPVAKP